MTLSVCGGVTDMHLPDESEHNRPRLVFGARLTWQRRAAFQSLGDRVGQIEDARPAVAAVCEQECRSMRTLPLFIPLGGCGGCRTLQVHAIE